MPHLCGTFAGTRLAHVSLIRAKTSRSKAVKHKPFVLAGLVVFCIPANSLTKVRIVSLPGLVGDVSSHYHSVFLKLKAINLPENGGRRTFPAVERTIASTKMRFLQDSTHLRFTVESIPGRRTGAGCDRAGCECTGAELGRACSREPERTQAVHAIGSADTSHGDRTRPVFEESSDCFRVANERARSKSGIRTTNPRDWVARMVHLSCGQKRGGGEVIFKKS